MTKFSGDAIGVRSSGPKGLTKRDLRKNLEKFIQTGVHPEIQKAQERAKATAVPSLPIHDANRDFVFLELSLGGQVLGRLVIELFSDLIPMGANHLRNRCLPGSKTGLSGTTVNKLQGKFAVWMGKNPAASEGMHLQSNPSLRHVDAGAVSVSKNGDDVAIALGRALVLDDTHQVVGRVHKGEDVLEKLNDIPVNHFDEPRTRVTVTKCGVTNASGTYEEAAAGAGPGDGQPTDPAARLAMASEGARTAVMQALAVGLQQKRKAEEGTTSKAATQPSSHTNSQTGGPSRNVKAKYMDSLLEGMSDEDSDESEEEADEGDKNTV